MKKIEITRCFVGICGMQVCAVASCTDEEILSLCNSENPSGTTMGWDHVVREGDEAFPNNAAPVTCDKFHDRKHYMVIC